MDIERQILVAVAWADIIVLAAIRFLAWAIPVAVVAIFIIWYWRR